MLNAYIHIMTVTYPSECQTLKFDECKWKLRQLFACKLIQVAQLSQRERAAGRVSYGQKWKTGTGRQYYTDRFTFNQCDVIGHWSAKKSNSVKKMQNKGYYAVQGHSRSGHQSKARMRLPISDNWHPILYRFWVTAALFKFWTLGVLEPHFGGLETAYDVHLGLNGKRVVDSFQCIELFFDRCYRRGATSENRSNIGILKAGIGQYLPNFRVAGDVPTNQFARIPRPMNALQLCRWQFSHKETL